MIAHNNNNNQQPNDRASTNKPNNASTLLDKQKDVNEEITNNDGSVVETLDTAFHGKPGWHSGENPSGSNRADYYEARSDGKTDSEEELDYLKENNKD